MGPCANLAKARATATRTDLQRDEHLVIAANKAGRLQRSASTRIDDDADRIKLLGIDITHEECPNGNNRLAGTWEKVQKTAAMARRRYAQACPDLAVTAMGMNQNLLPALKHRVMATLPTPAWVQCNVDGHNAMMLLRACGMSVAGTRRNMPRCTDMLPLLQRLPGTGALTLNALMTAEAAAQVPAMLAAEERHMHAVLLSAMTDAHAHGQNGDHRTTDRMLHRVADLGLQLHKAMQGNAAPLAPSEDPTLIAELNQGNAEGRIMCRALNLAEMQQHATLTDAAPLHASTQVHECCAIDQRNADQRSPHVHASEVLGCTAECALCAPGQQVGEMAKGPMYMAALDSTELRVDYRARSANADQRPTINPATAAFAFAQKSAEALLTPHPEHVHNGRTCMPLTDPAMLAHCNFTEAAKGVDGKHPILQKRARASLLSLPTAALRRLVDFKREAETAANITCGTEQGLETSTDASARSGGKQVSAACCELCPPAAAQPNATGSCQDRLRPLRDMRLLLLKARKTTQRDDNAQPDTQPRHLAEADMRKLACALAMSSAVYPKQHRWKPMVHGAGYSSGRSLMLADQPKGGAHCPDTMAEHMMWQHWLRLQNAQPTTTADEQLDPIILTAVQSLRDLREATGKHHENVIRDGMAPVALLALLQAMGCNAVTAQSTAVRITRQLADNGNSVERVHGDKVIQMLRRSGTLVDRTDGHGTVRGAAHCDLCGELAICSPLTTTELSAPVTIDLCQRATEAAQHRHTSAATSKSAATAHNTDGVQLCMLCMAPHVAQTAAEREHEKTALASQQNRALPSLRRQHSANSTTWRRMQRADEDPNAVVKQRCSADAVATTVWNMVRQLETTGHMQERTAATTDQGDPAPTNPRKRQCTTTSALTPITPTGTGDGPPPIPNATADPRRGTMNPPRRAPFPGATMAQRNQATTPTANAVDTEQAQPVTTMATANCNNHSAATSCGTLPAGDTTDDDVLPSMHAPAPIAMVYTTQSTPAMAPLGTVNNIAADAGRLRGKQNRVTPVTPTGQTTTPTVAVETTMATSCATARASHIVRVIHGSTTANARLGMPTCVIAACAEGHNHFVQLLDGRVRDWEADTNRAL